MNNNYNRQFDNIYLGLIKNVHEHQSSSSDSEFDFDFDGRLDNSFNRMLKEIKERKRSRKYDNSTYVLENCVADNESVCDDVFDNGSQTGQTHNESVCGDSYDLDDLDDSSWIDYGTHPNACSDDDFDNGNKTDQTQNESNSHSHDQDDLDDSSWIDYGTDVTVESEENALM